MNSISVIIVDDQRLMRDGLKLLLELEDDIELTGEAADGREGVTLYNSVQPDVVLMDIRMPNMTGIEATETILRNHPEAKIIILTTFDDDELIVKGIQAGAKGYMLKDLSGAELGEAIRKVAAGGAQLDAGVTNKLLAQISKGTISERSASNETLIEPLSERET
ncbi:MAG: response regulator transcription factor, partial [Chloroflexota bacterium]